MVEFNFYKMMKRGQRSFTVDHIEKSAPRLFALTNASTIMDVKRLVKEKMRGIWETVPETDEELNQVIEVHVKENLPMVKQGMYTRTRAVCEYCDEKHGYKDEYCDLKIDDVEVNESVESCQNLTLGEIVSK